MFPLHRVVLHQDKLGNSQFVVSLTFTDAGTKAFADATTKAYASGESIGIYYDRRFHQRTRVYRLSLQMDRHRLQVWRSFEEADKLAIYDPYRWFESGTGRITFKCSRSTAW